MFILPFRIRRRNARRASEVRSLSSTPGSPAARAHVRRGLLRGRLPANFGASRAARRRALPAAARATFDHSLAFAASCRAHHALAPRHIFFA